ncbi:MAG: shikimate kinase [Spirochaetales bacterium]
MNLYFCGLIGSGKTTIGQRIAKFLDLPFYDIDQEIDRRVGYSFHKLVQEQGWVPYRETEYAICKDLANSSRTSPAVVSMAGGTVRYEWNRDVLKGTGPVILLTASIPELARRVQTANRPRVNPGSTSQEEDLRLLWEKYKHTYLSAADVQYNTEGKEIEVIVQDLYRLILESSVFEEFRQTYKRKIYKRER